MFPGAGLVFIVEEGYLGLSVTKHHFTLLSGKCPVAVVAKVTKGEVAIKELNTMMMVFREFFPWGDGNSAYSLIVRS